MAAFAQIEGPHMKMSRQAGARRLPVPRRSEEAVHEHQRRPARAAQIAMEQKHRH
jgi:hypothetical protein